MTLISISSIIIGMNASINFIKTSVIGPSAALGLIFLITGIFSQAAVAQDFAEGYFRLTTKWLGNTRSLDVVNDGSNRRLRLAPTADSTGQYWKLTPVGNGYYRLTTKWLGETRALDVVNDGTNNKLQMADATGASGQYWKISPVGGGYFRLTTKWLGETRSLDVVNDGQNDQIYLAESGDKSGQYWKLTPFAMPVRTNDVILKNAKELEFHGFKIFVNDVIFDDELTKTALGVLSDNLGEMTQILKPEQVRKLRKVPVWIEFKRISDGGAWYHRSREWVLSNGYPEELVKTVEISNVRNFVDWQKSDQPNAILHEFAHAYHDLYLGDLQDEIKRVYEAAKTSGKYEAVDYVRGGKKRHYGLTDDFEFFAEMTETFFGRNDYFPYTREDLESFDPEAFRLMQKVWE